MGGGNRIVAQGQGMSVIPRESTGDGNYYLAPTVKFARVGLSNTAEEVVYIDENGDNHYGIENIFKTELKTFGLNLYYDSSNARDTYNTMGHWRNSFVSRLDFDINPEDIKDKSNFYETAREACESGFSDIKDTMYRGILSDATSVYDKNRDMCIIKEDGEDVGKFLVWNKESKRDDVHYLTTGDGEFILFVKDDEGKFTTEKGGVQITLNQDENGTFSYKDEKDVLRKYNSDGKLSYLMKEGQETYIEYGKDGKIAKVKGAMDNVMEFAYNEENLLSKISIGCDIRAEFDYSGNKMLSEYRFIVKDENGTDKILTELDLGYNEKNLLTEVKSPESPDGKDEVAVSSLYTYDNLNRVIMSNHNAFLEKYIYDRTKVVKLLSDGTDATANIAFKGSKQIIKDMKDSVVNSEFDYNNEGRLTELNLVEIDDSNTSANIESNALLPRRTLKLQMDYNTKGLINSQYLETSDGVKKFSNFEYKTKYNKPTKVLTDDSVVFFDFNNKGQLIKKSYLKYDKDMKIKPHSIDDIKQVEGYQEISYRYDENGFLVKKVNEVTKEENNYYTTVDGKTHEGNIQANSSSENPWQQWLRNWRNSNKPGFIDGVGTFNMSNQATTQTAFIGGAGEGWKHKTVKLYAQYARGGAKDFYYWWQQDDKSPAYYRKTPKSDPFLKQAGRNLMVIGHSWGGDSAVEASNYAAWDKGVDLLITIDPVGVGNGWSRARYWIEVYANPGRQWPGVKVKWKCGWFYCYPKFYYLKSEWNSSDWIAWSGGKGNWSAYDKGDAHPNDFIEVRAHHEEFPRMLAVLQKRKTNYSFNIRNNFYNSFGY